MTSKALVDRLENAIGAEGRPRRLISAIDEELRSYFGLLPIQASDRAEQIAPAIARIIAERSARLEKTGAVPTLTLLGTASDLVAGFCYVLSADAEEVAAAKQQRLHVGALLDAMRALTFNEFEKFGARVLNAIGAKYSSITPHRGDQGIDFFGHLTLGQLQHLPAPFVRLAHDIGLLFVGQAKHYPNSSLGPEIVRELIGAVSLARTKTFSKPGVDIFRGFDLKPFSPLVTLLFTTGKITSGALQVADSAGIIARSGEQLAVFLADKGVGMIQTETGPIFDQSTFTAWLDPEEY